MKVWTLQCSEACHILRTKLELLQDISTGKLPCDRHNRWLGASSKVRNSMKRESLHVDCLPEPVRKSVIDFLLSELQEFERGPRRSEWFAYVYEVLFPESAIMLMMEVDQLTHDSAIEAIHRGPPQPVIITLEGNESDESDLQLLARGASIQKNIRRPLVSGKKKQSQEVLKLRMVAIRSTRMQTYKRVGPMKEVDMSRVSTYSEVAVIGAEAVGIMEDMPSDGRWGLFHIDGTYIPEESEWNIGRYMASLKRTPSQMKLGVGVVDEFEEVARPKKRSKSGNHPDDDKVLVSESTSLSEIPEYYVEVLYAPKLGPRGVDLTLPVSRQVVFHMTVNKSQFPPPLFYPEVMSYCVSSITNGNNQLLCLSDNGSYAVVDDVEDKLEVIHQTQRTVMMKQVDIAIPIYCIASGHNFDLDYRWQLAGQNVGLNSPVLWVSGPGTYFCTVVKGLKTCMSALITVKDACTSYVNSPPHSDELAPFSLSTKNEPSPSTLSFVDGRAMVFHKQDINDACGDIIGTGGFGTVYKGVIRCTDVAIKVLSKRGMNSLVTNTNSGTLSSEDPRANVQSLLATEVATLTRFRHPHLVGIMGYCIDPPSLVYPLMREGSLYDNLHKYRVKNHLSMEARVEILRDVSSGLAYLHHENPPVVHHDINSMNILLDRHSTGKLADFGFSIQLPKTHGNKTMITASVGLPGTNGYRPPEYGYSKFSVLSDVYSLGVVVLECFTGRLAFSDDHNLVDETEDERSDSEAFARLADPKAGPVVSSSLRSFN